MSFVVAPSCDVWEFSVNSKRMKPILFIPIYQERVWGGTDLKTKLGRDDLPTGKVIGESWEMVDRPDASTSEPPEPAQIPPSKRNEHLPVSPETRFTSPMTNTCRRAGCGKSARPVRRGGVAGGPWLGL